MARRSNILRRWKMERATVHHNLPAGRQGVVRSRSNKYSGNDREAMPKAHKRHRVWVGGYKKRDGTKVAGYYRDNAQFGTRS